MGRVIEIRGDYIAKYEHLNKYASERPDAKFYGLLVDEDIVSVCMIADNRLMYLHTRPDSRRGGYATELVDYVMRNHLDRQKPIRAVVEPDNIPALQFLISKGFYIRGFEVSHGDNRYMMEHGFKWVQRKEDPLHKVKADFERMVDCLYVVESVPIRIVR